MNKKEIIKIDKKIKLANEYATVLNKLYNKNHHIDYLDTFIPNDYDINKKIKDLEYLKEVLTRLTEKGININKEYKIMENIYLSINVDSNISFYIYVNNDCYLYNNFIKSHSGINEWIFNTIADLYDLYSGNSDYNYALGTVSLRGYKTYIENKPKDQFSDRPHTAEQVADVIEYLINILTDKNNKVTNAIIKDLKFKFKIMKKLTEE